jgi:hypothetical protein BACCOPRO_00453
MTALSDIMTAPKVDPAEADDLHRKFPYFLYPQVSAFGSARDPETLRRLRRRLSALIGDREALERIAGSDTDDSALFYPDLRPENMSTAETIDNFLDRFGSPVATPVDGVGGVGIVPVAPAIDYAATMLAEVPDGPEVPSPDKIADSVETPGTADATDMAIAQFLGVTTPPKERNEAEPKRRSVHDERVRRDPETPALTESLAKIMVKNGNYRKALEIITQLNLKNPEKSIYFADQIRFLRKLILNQSKS